VSPDALSLVDQARGDPVATESAVPEVDVRLVDVVKKFGEQVAVDHINLEVRDGEFFSLLGPSGCGKTTTLRMIGGFEQPTSGLIELQGQDVTWLPPYRRNVNTVFQNYALFPHLTVYENVAFGLRRKGVKGGDIKGRVTDMLKLVELPGFEARKPNQISGGQAQRVALARALINRPAVLLLDEPLGALDLKLRQEMQLELKRLQTELGNTFIYVTHDQDEALGMSDRIGVFSDGRLEQIGTPGEVYEHPASEFVAGFVGESNVLQRDGERVTIRPEKIRMLGAGEEPGDGWVAEDAVVREVLYLGAVTRFATELADGEALTVISQNLHTSAEQAAAQRGRPVRLAWRRQHAAAIDSQAKEQS
jgi:ABC-type Fe3+/spermidine/putrescine transport system ATPase subunit